MPPEIKPIEINNDDRRNTAKLVQALAKNPSVFEHILNLTDKDSQTIGNAFHALSTFPEKTAAITLLHKFRKDLPEALLRAGLLENLAGIEAAQAKAILATALKASPAQKQGFGTADLNDLVESSVALVQSLPPQAKGTSNPIEEIGNTLADAISTKEATDLHLVTITTHLLKAATTPETQVALINVVNQAARTIDNNYTTAKLKGDKEKAQSKISQLKERLETKVKDFHLHQTLTDHSSELKDQIQQNEKESIEISKRIQKLQKDQERSDLEEDVKTFLDEKIESENYKLAQKREEITQLQENAEKVRNQLEENKLDPEYLESIPKLIDQLESQSTLSPLDQAALITHDTLKLKPGDLPILAQAANASISTLLLDQQLTKNLSQIPSLQKEQQTAAALEVAPALFINQQKTLTAAATNPDVQNIIRTNEAIKDKLAETFNAALNPNPDLSEAAVKKTKEESRALAEQTTDILLENSEALIKLAEVAAENATTLKELNNHYKANKPAPNKVTHDTSDLYNALSINPEMAAEMSPEELKEIVDMKLNAVGIDPKIAAEMPSADLQMMVEAKKQAIAQQKTTSPPKQKAAAEAMYSNTEQKSPPTEQKDYVSSSPTANPEGLIFKEVEKNPLPRTKNSPSPPSALVTANEALKRHREAIPIVLEYATEVTKAILPEKENLKALITSITNFQKDDSPENLTSLIDKGIDILKNPAVIEAGNKFLDNPKIIETIDKELKTRREDLQKNIAKLEEQTKEKTQTAEEKEATLATIKKNKGYLRLLNKVNGEFCVELFKKANSPEKLEAIKKNLKEPSFINACHVLYKTKSFSLAMVSYVTSKKIDSKRKEEEKTFSIQESLENHASSISVQGSYAKNNSMSRPFVGRT